MLVLTRKPGQRIVIGDDIVITVISATKDGLRIGIAAPRSVEVHRAEIVEEVSAANTTAVRADDSAESTLVELLGGRGQG